MSDNWITDRVPTEADADPDGEVITRRGLDPDDWVHIHWSLIRPGNSWCHSNNLNQPAEDYEDEDYEDALIELISEAPEPPEQPAQPAVEIAEPIRTGAAPFYVLIVRGCLLGDRLPLTITWETQSPEGSSLQAVLQQQSRVCQRYGTTHIAECRIIPELTREVPTDAG